MEEEKKEKGFVIKDRRLFDESGSVRKEEEATAEEKKPEIKTDETKAPAGRDSSSRNRGRPPSRDQFYQLHLFTQHDRNVSLRRLPRSGHQKGAA